MKRRSRLAVVERLARLRERQALEGFAFEQRRVREAHVVLDDFEERVARERAVGRLDSGRPLLVGGLVEANRRRVAFERRRDAAREDHETCGHAAESARKRLAQARLQVRAVCNAIERREARERVRRRRVETRRLDEAARGASAWRRSEDAAS